MLKLKLPLAALLILSACAAFPADSAIDRLKPYALRHADALQGASIPVMQKTGADLLEVLAAYANW